MVFDFEKEENSKGDEVTLHVTYKFTRKLPRDSYPEEMSVKEMARLEAEACTVNPAETIEWGLEYGTDVYVEAKIEYGSSEFTATGEDVLTSS